MSQHTLIVSSIFPYIFQAKVFIVLSFIADIYKAGLQSTGKRELVQLASLLPPHRQGRTVSVESILI